MDFKVFLENFDAIAEAPGGIPKLRELILDLAVRGKLVPQNSEDKPASVLVEKIRFKKEQLIKEKKIRQSDSLRPVELKEMSHEVPNGWEWVRFGDATICRDGERIPLSKEHRTLRQGEYDYYGASGVIDKIDDYLFDEPLLLIGEDGANLINRSTPIAFIASGKYWVNNHAHVLDSLSVDCLRYFEVFINSIDLKSYITGTAQPKMNQAKMNSIPVPLPPLAEQKRIVEKVDELMALCDRYEAAKQTRDNLRQKLRGSAINSLMNAETDKELDAAWDFVRDNWHNLSQQPEDADNLKQAILQLAVQGKLTFHSSSEQSASVLLQAIRDERTQLVKNKILRQTKPLSISEDDIPFNTFSNWEWEKLGNLCFVTKLAGFEYTEYINLKDKGEIPVVRAQNVRMDRLDTKNLKFIDLETSKLLERSALTQPAILMTFIGAGIGDVAVFNLIQQRWHLAPNVAKLEPFNHYGEKIDIRYLLLFLMSKTGRNEIFKQRKSTAQPSLSMETIRDINVIVPPLAEQKRIVTKVDELMQLCDKLEASLRQSQQRAESLAASAIRHLTI